MSTVANDYDPRWRNASPTGIRSAVRDRDGDSEEAIDELFLTAAEEIAEGAEPEDVLSDVFGLEPDYIFDEEFLRTIRAAWAKRG